MPFLFYFCSLLLYSQLSLWHHEAQDMTEADSHLQHTSSEMEADEAPEEEYTVQETARVLRRSERRITQMLEAGDLPGRKETGRWMIPQYAVHELMPQMRPTAQVRRVRSPGGPTEDASELPERVAELSRELGRLEGRMELTEVAESTLRESVERERERADQERQERLQAQKESWQAQEEARRLRAELEAERGKGFFRRLFGR